MFDDIFIPMDKDIYERYPLVMQQFDNDGFTIRDSNSNEVNFYKIVQAEHYEFRIDNSVTLKNSMLEFTSQVYQLSPDKRFLDMTTVAFPENFLQHEIIKSYTSKLAEFFRNTLRKLISE